MKFLSRKTCVVVLLLIFASYCYAVEITHYGAVAAGVIIAATAFGIAAPIAMGSALIGGSIVPGVTALVAGVFGTGVALSGLDWSSMPPDQQPPESFKSPPETPPGGSTPNPGGGTPVWFDLPKAPLSPEEVPFLDKKKPFPPAPLYKSSYIDLPAGPTIQFTSTSSSDAAKTGCLKVASYLNSTTKPTYAYSSHKCEDSKLFYQSRSSGAWYPASNQPSVSSTGGNGCGDGFKLVDGLCKIDPATNPLAKKPPLVRKPDASLEPNPANPPPDAVITTHNPDGSTTTRTIPAGSSASDGGTAINGFPDGSTSIIVGKRLPDGTDVGIIWYVDPQGAVVGGNTYSSTGKLPTSGGGGSSSTGGGTGSGTGTGTGTDPGTGNTGSGGTSTGGNGGGTGTGTGTGNGDCASYGCAKESTLQSFFGYIRGLFDSSSPDAKFKPPQGDGKTDAQKFGDDLNAFKSAANIDDSNYSGIISKFADSIGLSAGGQCQNASFHWTIWGRPFNVHFVELCTSLSPIINWFFWILIFFVGWRDIQLILTGQVQQEGIAIDMTK